MRIIKSLIAAAGIALCGVNAMAQTEATMPGGVWQEAQELGYKPNPYYFIQVQGGAGTLLTDIGALKVINPTFSVAVGDMFTPIVGARLHVNGWKSKGGFENVPVLTGDILSNQEMKYNFNYINTNVDLMLNIVNIFSKKVSNPFALYFIGGVGLNYAWNNDEFENIVSQYSVKEDISNAWGDKQTPRKSLLGHNLRLGLLADYNVSKNFSVGVEVDFNSLDDRFNSKYKDKDDWMMTASLSLTYKFGYKKVKPVVVPPEPEPVVIVPEPVEEVVVPVEEPKPVVIEEPIKETIFYAIRESDLDSQTIINKVVDWCKKYPNKTITIDGYADKGTGNSKLNVEYAKKRADKVAEELQAMGVPASQMTVKSYGDTVQPFAENDRNRCVIIEGK
ncbi:MAG: OmpA family protein [Prevotellaceae bacterium]|nr:OmpA family protein [Prevotellaceae bacterium]